jgi:hypothetical protein
MIETEATLRRWGRSLGIVVPQKDIIEAGFKENEEIKVTLMKKNNPLEKTFGKLKFKKPTAQILRESDKEAWDE